MNTGHEQLHERIAAHLPGGGHGMGDADQSKFTPRKFYKTTQIPAGGLAATNALYVADFETPPAGKIWNLRFAALFSNDPTGGSWSATPGSPWIACIGAPNHGDGYTQAQAALNLEEVPYFDQVTGATSIAAVQAAVSLPRYVHWVWPGERVYAILLSAAAFAAGSDVILSYRFDEYDQDRIVYGERSTGAIQAFRESLFPPRQQA